MVGSEAIIMEWMCFYNPLAKKKKKQKQKQKFWELGVEVGSYRIYFRSIINVYKIG